MYQSSKHPWSHSEGILRGWVLLFLFGGMYGIAAADCVVMYSQTLNNWRTVTIPTTNTTLPTAEYLDFSLLGDNYLDALCSILLSIAISLFSTAAFLLPDYVHARLKHLCREYLLPTFYHKVSVLYAALIFLAPVILYVILDILHFYHYAVFITGLILLCQAAIACVQHIFSVLRLLQLVRITKTPTGEISNISYNVTFYRDVQLQLALSLSGCVIVYGILAFGAFGNLSGDGYVQLVQNVLSCIGLVSYLTAVVTMITALFPMIPFSERSLYAPTFQASRECVPGEHQHSYLAKDGQKRTRSRASALSLTLGDNINIDALGAGAVLSKLRKRGQRSMGTLSASSHHGERSYQILEDEQPPLPHSSKEKGHPKDTSEPINDSTTLPLTESPIEDHPHDEEHESQLATPIASTFALSALAAGPAPQEQYTYPEKTETDPTAVSNTSTATPSHTISPVSDVILPSEGMSRTTSQTTFATATDGLSEVSVPQDGSTPHGSRPTSESLIKESKEEGDSDNDDWVHGRDMALEDLHWRSVRRNTAVIIHRQEDAEAHKDAEASSSKSQSQHIPQDEEELLEDAKVDEEHEGDADSATVKGHPITE
ncbi:hypothetical protein BZG36_04021 [Bifiguratus adelaidae]|uniref:Uncharacterized protein n=1 Tax=Bifiguratus adelaidae TaxID=1938954 RepID=A0A261XZ08_9FUNG|nr:hypothetical protein BZG36_04021 [Bifiguratus adelaidae]